jgi:hypothetical protein
MVCHQYYTNLLLRIINYVMSYIKKKLELNKNV